MHEFVLVFGSSGKDEGASGWLPVWPCPRARRARVRRVLACLLQPRRTKSGRIAAAA